MLTVALILFPLAISLMLAFGRNEKAIRQFAFAASVTEFVFAAAALVIYRVSCPCDLLFETGWILPLGVSLKFGMDGISLLLVLLTTFLVPVIILDSFSRNYRRPGIFYALILFTEMALVGVFTAFDGLVFYIFWELALIPAYFICALWGGDDRIRITFKFFIYTFTGSLFMLVALIWLWFRTPLPHSFDYQWLIAARLTPAEQAWVFAAFFLAFAIKIPVFPFHTWQPGTYAVAPPAGSMMLAGIMLKMGLFGMIRWIIPVTPDAMQQYAPYAIALALTGLVYASVIAIRQDDLKRLIAYSSIAHVGLITAGIFTLNRYALEGAVIQMVSHGINITGLFMVAGFIEQRAGTRRISELGGLAHRAPRLAVVFMIVLLASIALPLTNGFVGEFLLLLGIFEYSPAFAAIGGLTVILSAVYMLWMYQRTMFGDTNPVTEQVQDLSPAGLAVYIPLILMIFWIGIIPGIFLETAGHDIMQLLTLIR